MAATMNIIVFWDVTPCSLGKNTAYIFSEAGASMLKKKEAHYSSEMLIPLY
jgi:hypothetical protein